MSILQLSKAPFSCFDIAALITRGALTPPPPPLSKSALWLPSSPAVCFQQCPAHLRFGSHHNPASASQLAALIHPAAARVRCSARSASQWVSTCWCHPTNNTQEKWLHSLQQGRKWAKQRKYLSECTVFSAQSGYLVTVCQRKAVI